MSHKNRKALGGNQGGGQTKLENGLTMNTLIVPQTAKISQIQIKIELDESLAIASEWLQLLFTSDDSDDETRLADVWSEYLRQRAMWSEVGQPERIERVTNE